MIYHFTNFVTFKKKQ